MENRTERGEMGWRNYKTHLLETKAVKKALKEAGLPFSSVGHSTGTAWAWLEIKTGQTVSFETRETILRVVQEVTGRRGDYNGKILVE